MLFILVKMGKPTGNSDKCTKDSSKRKYNRKRKYYGKQYSNKKTVVSDATTEASRSTKSRRTSVVTEDDKKKTASHRKLKNVVSTQSNALEGFRLIDMSILHNLLGLLCCPECLEYSLVIEEDITKRKGLSSFLTVNCSSCPFSWSSHTSKGVKDNQRIMEVNLRSVYAMRRCGVGHNGLQKFCGAMNMPPPVTRKNYSKLSDRLGAAVEKVAKTSMIEASVEVKQQEGSDIGISFDGTWQKKGT